MIQSQGIHPGKVEAYMVHKATLTKKLGVRPFHIECSCNGTGGDFFDADSAKQFMAVHAARIKGSSGETVEIVDKTAEVAKPEIAQPPKPVPPVVAAKPPVAPVVAPKPAPVAAAPAKPVPPVAPVKAKDDTAT